MPRNIFWTPAVAEATRSLPTWQAPDQHMPLRDEDGDGTLEGQIGDSLGPGVENLDFITVDLVVGGNYLFVAAGDYTPSLAIYDWDGYLLNYADGDDLPGYRDGAGVDSIYNFRPDYTGTYYLSVAWEYVQGATGVYGLAGGSINTVAQPPPPPPPGPALNSVSGTAEGDVLDGMGDGDSIRGYSGDDTIRGLDGNDIVHGDDGNDDVNGNLGDDIVHGGSGQDFARGGQGNDTVYGQDGDDWHVNGNIGDDKVYGGDGHDQVFGGPGQDTLYGEAGNDTLSGDLDGDILFGGPGADVFAVYGNGGWDVIQDFRRNEGDKIHIAAGINGTDIGSFAQLVGRISADPGGSALIDLGDGHKLGIVGMAPGSLLAADFVFG